MLSETTEITPARIYLQPVAAPSILGLYGFAGAMFMVAANLAGWYGNGPSSIYLVPFVFMFGGIAQFLAGMWAFKARDGLATAMHGMWGAFWIAFGILTYMFGRGGLPTGTFPELGYWFIVLCAITAVCAWAALAENVSLFLVLAFVAIGSLLEAIAKLSTTAGAVQIAAGYAFIISAVLAFYTASALMLAEAYGHSVLGIGKMKKDTQAPIVSLGAGEPGVIRGQNLNLAPGSSAS
ncbi:MAG TPA: GPR1/FUN34/YaaH family transporter [Bryobacteraceae bacterium]|nr:GPR1/FUN34/YaaH family transporter [Bryobacteraceae bacterium]